MERALFSQGLAHLDSMESRLSRLSRGKSHTIVKHCRHELRRRRDARRRPSRAFQHPGHLEWGGATWKRITPSWRGFQYFEGMIVAGDRAVILTFDGGALVADLSQPE